MDYLTIQLLWYMLAAFLFGLVVGWFSGRRADDGTY
jgi:hypothetical protein